MHRLKKKPYVQKLHTIPIGYIGFHEASQNFWFDHGKNSPNNFINSNVFISGFRILAPKKGRKRDTPSVAAVFNSTSA